MAAVVGVQYGASVQPADSPEVVLRVQAGLTIVDQVARRFARELGGSLELDDLVGYGNIALLAAARRFEPDRGLPFEAYAAYRIRLALTDAARSLALPRRTYERLRAIDAATRQDEGLAEHTFAAKPQPSAPSMARKRSEAVAAMATAIALGVMADVAPQADGEWVGVERSDPEQNVSKAQLNALVIRLVDGLPDDEAQLVRRHYFEGEHFDKVAKDLKISKSWASRLHSRAIARLGRQVERAG